MIIGTGIDIVEIPRIETLAKRFPRFAERILTPAEQALYRKRSASSAFLATRFAGKEAALKALGCGLREGIAWHDMEILPNELGQPKLSLSGGTLARLQRLTPGARACLHVSLSDSKQLAVAHVIVEAR